MPDEPCCQKPRIYDWQCQHTTRFHLGPHRFNNYTWRRGAKQIAFVRGAWVWLRSVVNRDPSWRRQARVFAATRTRSTYAPLGNNDPWWAERRRKA